MSAIDKAVELLRREAECMKKCHTIGVNGEWYGESAKDEYDEMIAVADAAIAERDELLVALRKSAENDPYNLSSAGRAARAAIARATGESE